jgi:molybdenum cofactor guanylyltransferase
MVDRSAIILAGNSNDKFESDKGSADLNGKPLLKHVTDSVATLVDETIVVTDSDELAKKYTKIIGEHVSFAVDEEKSIGPLMGALTGFSKANGKYSLLLPCDAPFVSKDILLLLFELCINRSAAIPRYPDQRIEALQAAYNTKIALAAARESISDGKHDLASMVEKMHGVRYVSTMVIEQLDPNFRSFFRIKTAFDLKKTSAVLSRGLKKL